MVLRIHTDGLPRRKFGSTKATVTVLQGPTTSVLQSSVSMLHKKRGGATLVDGVLPSMAEVQRTIIGDAANGQRQCYHWSTMLLQGANAGATNGATITHKMLLTVS
jgi:hypothetical protein